MAAKTNTAGQVSQDEVLEYLKITGEFAHAERAVRERRLATEAARKAGLKVTPKELQKAADGFRALMDLTKASDTEKWLRKNDLSVDALENHLELNILKSKFIDSLEKDGEKYHNTKAVKQTVRELAYRDWLAKSMK